MTEFGLCRVSQRDTLRIQQIIRADLYLDDLAVPIQAQSTGRRATWDTQSFMVEMHIHHR
jgi:hypothetical protein